MGSATESGRFGTRLGLGDDAGAPSSRRRLVVLLCPVVIVVAGVWGVLAYSQLRTVQDDVLGARDQLLQAREALESGELGQADDLFVGAAATLSSVPGRVRGPLVAPVRLLRTYRASLDDVADLAMAAELVAQAGGRVTGELQLGGEDLGILAPRDGRIPVDMRSQPRVRSSLTYSIQRRGRRCHYPRCRGH